eukprot:6462648-Pyramimonas_sp.AAC.1
MGSRSIILHRYSESPWPERPPNSGTALSLETSSHFSQCPTRKRFPPKVGAIEDELGGYRGLGYTEGNTRVP